jgi:hypothetical protein
MMVVTLPDVLHTWPPFLADFDALEKYPEVSAVISRAGPGR